MSEDATPRDDNEAAPSVSVVIPTIGRLELIRALRSVRAQRTSAQVELIVVHDGGPGTELPAEATELADRVLHTAGRLGPAHARNLGIAEATGDLIALLDDDDEWVPDKLEEQFAVLRKAADPAHTVVGSRQVYLDSRTGVESRPSPNRLIAQDETIERYLFRRRPPSGGRPSMSTPTLICPRALATSTLWDDSLALHEDWDWLVRLGRRPGVSFVQAPGALVRVQRGSAQSISATTDWRSSLDWANKALRNEPAVYADFIAGQCLRYALGARSWTGVRSILAALRQSKRVPSLGPLIIGCAGLLPRRATEWATVAIGGVR